MKTPLSILLLLTLISWEAIADGDNLFYDLNTKTTDQKNFLSIGPEISSISGGEEGLQGFGAAIQYSHAFDDDWGAGITLSQHFNGGGGTGTVLYSGLSAKATYAIFGSLKGTNQSVRYKGRPILTTNRLVSNVLTVGLSIDQLFLNGTDQVYPATGAVLSTSYQTELFGTRIKPSLGFGNLTGPRDEGLSIIKVGILFNFSI